MKRFKKFRDDRFALTTLQNPLCDPQAQADLAHAAREARPGYPRRAEIPATLSPVNSNRHPRPASRPRRASRGKPLTRARPAGRRPRPTQFPKWAAQQPPKPEKYVTVVKLKPGLASKNVQPATREASQKAKSRRTSNSQTSDAQLLGATFRLNDFLARADKLGVLHDHEPMDPYEPPQESLSEADLAELSPVERHSRKCSICHHPQRQEIEEDFVHWRRPTTIMKLYAIGKRATIYGHAHAFGLLDVRARNLRSALGILIEKGDDREPSAMEVIEAVRLFAHVSPQGEWVQPVNRTEVRSENRTEVVVCGKRSPASADGDEILIGTPQLLETDANH